MGPVKYVIFFIMGLITAKQKFLIPRTAIMKKTKTDSHHSLWYLGDLGENCDDTCSKVGGECDGVMLEGIFSEDQDKIQAENIERGKEAASALGINCTEWHFIGDDGFYGLPAQRTGNLYNSPTGSCMVSDHGGFCRSYPPGGDYQRFCPCKVDLAEHKSCSANPLQGTPINSFDSRDAAGDACRNMATCDGYQDRSCDGVFQEGGNDFFLCGASDTWADSSSSCIILVPNAPTASPTSSDEPTYDPWGSLSEILTTTTQHRHPNAPSAKFD